MEENSAAAGASRPLRGAERRIRLEEREWSSLGSRLLPSLLQRHPGEESSVHASFVPLSSPPPQSPLLPQQALSWQRERDDPGNRVAKRMLALDFRGKLDVTALKRSLAEIVRRHDILRAVFEVRDDRVCLVVPRTGDVDVSVTPVNGSSAAEQNALYHTEELAEVRRSFDVASGPLFRARLLRLDSKHHRLLLTAHELVCDEWSLDIFFEELVSFYSVYAVDQQSPWAERALQFTDLLTWQQRLQSDSAWTNGLAFWQLQLLPTSPPLALPTDRPLPATASVESARHPLNLSQLLAAGLKTISGDRITLALFAGITAWLSAVTKQTDIVIGAETSGRRYLETAGMIGPLSQLLLLRTDLSGDPTGQEILRRVRATMRATYANQETAATWQASTWDQTTPNESPLPRVVVRVKPAVKRTVKWPRLSVERREVDIRAASYDILVDVVQSDDQLVGWLTYRTDLFGAPTIAALADHMISTLTRFAANPAQPLSATATPPALPTGGVISMSVPLQPVDPAAAPSQYAEATDGPVRQGVRAAEVSIVPLLDEGSDPPVFLVPNGFGGRAILRSVARLAARLGPAVRSYAFHVDGINSKLARDNPSAWANAICVQHLNLLLATQPDSPYRLVGVCGGGYAAFEMAQQLMAQGEEVATLVLIDTWQPGAWSPRSEGAVPAPDVVRDSIVRSYRPRPFHGRLVLIANETWYQLNPTLGWDTVAQGGLAVHVVPGDHRILHPDRIEVVAARVREALAASPGQPL